MVRVAGIRKTYGRTVAVDDVPFEAQPDEILGLIGPNGAGKTTTMECVEGLRQPDRGLIEVFGIDPTRRARALQDRIGVQLQEAQLQKLIKSRSGRRSTSGHRSIPRRSTATGSSTSWGSPTSETPGS